MDLFLNLCKIFINRVLIFIIMVYNKRNDYTGEEIEPVEDLLIIQEDGSRACLNWECKVGFQLEDFIEKPSVVGIPENDAADLFLNSRE